MAHTLFIANPTKQNHVFMYFQPSVHDEYREETISGAPRRIFVRYGTPRRVLDIRAGGQISISGLDQHQVDGIVKQHKRYGMRSQKEFEQGELSSLVYNIDTPVSLVHIEHGLKTRDDFLTDRSREIREDTAAAVAQQIQNTMGDMGVDVPRVEVSTVEETKSRDQRPKISEGYEINKEGVSPRHSGATPSKRGGNIPY